MSTAGWGTYSPGRVDEKPSPSVGQVGLATLLYMLVWVQGVPTNDSLPFLLCMLSTCHTTPQDTQHATAGPLDITPL